MVRIYLYCTITRMRKAEDLVICSVVMEQGFALIGIRGVERDHVLIERRE